MPTRRCRGVFDQILKVVAGCKVTDLQCVEFRALVVIAPDGAAVIAAVVEAAEIEIGLVPALQVTVEQHLAQRRVMDIAIARDAEEIGLLAAGAVGRTIGVSAVLGRNRAIILLDPARISANRFFCNASVSAIAAFI